jgi:hypothetical protein
MTRTLKEKRIAKLKKWGYLDGDSDELREQAEACAEPATAADRVVCLTALAFRRFRTEFLRPLLAMPEVDGNTNARHSAKDRLARAIKEFGGDAEEKSKLMVDLAKALRAPLAALLRSRLGLRDLFFVHGK